MTLAVSLKSVKSYSYIHIQDEKTSSHGGTFTSGAWRTRDLNQIKTDETGSVSLSSNQITLPAGTYICKIMCPARGALDGHTAKLYNITDSADILIGTATSSASGDVNHSFVTGKFTLASSKVVEVQHRCDTTVNTTGFGAEGPGNLDVYTVAEFWKQEEIQVLEITC